MSKYTKSHHSIPKFLADFADHCGVSTKKRTFSRKRSARAHFASLEIEGAKHITGAKIPFTEIPDEKFPAIYFTRQGQHPVVIQENTPMGYSIRLWDGRESLCDRRRLEKTLEPEGFFLSEKNTGKGNALKKLLSALVEDKRHLGLGIANGAVNCSLLVVFVYLLHHVFQSAFPVAGMSSVGYAAAGIFASLLSTCGYLQARSLITTFFDTLYATNRSREMKMPPPFPVKALTNAASGRILTEAASSPFFLAAAAIIVGYDAESVAAWGTLVGCSVPAFFFLANLPGLVDRWNQALWFFDEKPVIVEETPLVAEIKPNESQLTPLIDDSVVRAHNLYLAHPDETRAPLLDHLSVKIAKGEKVGFLGMSNGDVPVFLRVISGLLSSDRGLVWIDGKMVNGDQTNNIGWFSERTSLLDGTMRENICLDRSRNLSDADIAQTAKLTGLDQIKIYQAQGLDAPVSETGNNLTEEDKIRILLTRSLVHKPETLIFDSPRLKNHFADFREILEAYLAEKSCTLLLGGKNSDQLKITNRIVVIENGKVVKDGPTAQVLESLGNEAAINP